MSSSPIQEEEYKQLTHIQHVRERPDSYVGSLDPYTGPGWVASEDGTHMEFLPALTVYPGYVKIFEEILSNAVDNTTRDPPTTAISVTLGPDQLSIHNNGRSIPITHTPFGCRVPELIFGRMLTSSNYNDAQNRTTSGRNGYGAKLCNIFSTLFTVTIGTPDGEVYTQTWRDGMTVCDPPVISRPRKAPPVSVQVSWTPDVTLLKGATDHRVLIKRLLDVAGTHPALKVCLNGTRLKVASFKEYALLYGAPSVVCREIAPGWDVAVTPHVPNGTGASFVNGVHTSSGGTHVAHVVGLLVKYLGTYLKRPVTAAVLSSCVDVYIRATVVNPTFGSQGKEKLTLPVSKWGVDVELSDTFKRALRVDTVLMGSITTALDAQDTKKLARKSGTHTRTIHGITKLNDAVDAGTSRGHTCTLILTEGDSAKTLAVAGVTVVGQTKYGVFPLKGKLTNVKRKRAAVQDDDTDNEVAALVKILGLKYGRTYTTQSDISTLRYGHVMIMADQDTDGSHIKGLIITFFQDLWPSLLQFPGFLSQFITPLVRAVKGSTARTFYTEREFNDWYSGVPDAARWNIRYYKGLGTNNYDDMKSMFRSLGTHQVPFVWNDAEDGKAIDLVFNPARPEDRRAWYEEKIVEVGVTPPASSSSTTRVSYTQFVNTEMLEYTATSILRSIPHLMDGLKPSQRKILYACLGRQNTSIKVAQLAGYTSQTTAYHHGETSLCEAIIGMAQDYVGTNNLPLLVPESSFGTRLGGDAAAPRYIYTHLQPYTRSIFMEKDDGICKPQSVEGKVVEPQFYVPIIPMVLVNGASGIATGWSTDVPCYRVTDVIGAVRACIHGATVPPLVPWYKGFKGVVRHTTGHRWVSEGVYTVSWGPSAAVVHITELPLFEWTTKYVGYLDELVKKGAVTGYTHVASEIDVDMRVTVPLCQDATDHPTDESLVKLLQLRKDIPKGTGNMHLVHPDGRIAKYGTPEEIIVAFCEERKGYYMARYECEMEALKSRHQELLNRKKYVDAVLSKQVHIFESEETIMKEMEALGILNGASLLKLSVLHLTEHHRRQLDGSVQKAAAAVVELESKNGMSLWLEDLAALEEVT